MIDAMSNQRFPHHDESTAVVHAPAERVFARLDDPKSLSAHMGESSMMMMGSRMSIDVDAGGGQIVGSKIRMYGSVIGIPISLEEVICERQPPFKKRWETIGTPKLIVMAHYRMGFEVTPSGDSSLVRVFIDYSLPTGFVGRCLGRLFGAVYAKWCTQRMTRDAAERFPREPVKENT
jgi:polyketide cyclase/dehydrase/lipid transport protein